MGQFVHSRTEPVQNHKLVQNVKDKALKLLNGVSYKQWQKITSKTTANLQQKVHVKTPSISLPLRLKAASVLFD